MVNCLEKHDRIKVTVSCMDVYPARHHRLVDIFNNPPETSGSNYHINNNNNNNNNNSSSSNSNINNHSTSLSSLNSLDGNSIGCGIRRGGLGQILANFQKSNSMALY
ncbi:hypothetical protein ACTFIR_009664 [Dictyostelium discoideum]